MQQLIWETTGCGLCHRSSFLNPPPTLKPPRGTPSQYKRVNGPTLQKIVKITILYVEIRIYSVGNYFSERSRDTILELHLFCTSSKSIKSVAVWTLNCAWNDEGIGHGWSCSAAQKGRWRGVTFKCYSAMYTAGLTVQNI